MANSYTIGQRVRVSVTFGTDPSTVKFKYRLPSGTITTLTYGVDGALVKDSSAHYHVDLDVTAAGDYACRFEGSGNQFTAVEGTFNVAWGTV